MKRNFVTTIVLFVMMISGGLFAAQATLSDANAQANTATTAESAAALDRELEVWVDVPTADVDWFVTSTALANKTCTLANAYNIYPRNVTVTVTDVNEVTVLTAFTVTVTGVNQKGVTQVEAFTASGWTSGVSKVGNHAFMSITSIVITACAGNDAQDTITVGFGTKVGLINPLAYTTDIVNVSEISTTAENITATANATYDTIDLSGTAPNGVLDYAVYYITRSD